MNDIRLTSDMVFKYVFGHRDSTENLRSLLSAVQTDAGYPAVAEVTIENPFSQNDFLDSKTSIVDVRAVDAEGMAFTIEVQTSREASFEERALYYWMKAGEQQLLAGEPYGTLMPTVGVNFLDFMLYPTRGKIHTTFVMTAMDDLSLTLLRRNVIHMIELPKVGGVEEGAGRPTCGELSAFDRWVYYLHQRGHGTMNPDPILLQILKDSPDIQAAEERYQRFLSDKELRNQYYQRDKNERDYANRMSHAREEGREEGKRAQALETARVQKSLGVDPKAIAAGTGLSEEDIAQL